MKLSSNTLFLTQKELDEVYKLDISKEALNKNFRLSATEITTIKNMRKSYIMLGYSLQLLFLRGLGRNLPSDSNRIPQTILEYVSEQLNISSNSLSKYWDIEITKKRNLRKLMDQYEFSRFQTNKEIEKIAFRLAVAIPYNKDFTIAFLEELKRIKIVSPGFTTIEPILVEAKKRANDYIFQSVVSQISDISKLDNLLDITKTGESVYAQLKHTSVNISSNGAKQLLTKIKYINDLQCNCSLDFLSNEMSGYYRSEIKKSNKTRIQRFSDRNKKYAYLAMFLHFRRKAFIDMVIEVTTGYAHKVMKRTKNKAQNHNATYHKNYKVNSERLKDVIKDIMGIDDFEKFKEYRNKLRDLKEELDSQEEELEDIDFLIKTHQSFNYTNELLESIEFDSNTKPELIELLKIFPTFKYKKKLEIDTSFFSRQWQKYIKKYDYSKRVIEIAVLYSIRDNIRSGDLFVRESQKYNSFDYYLIDKPKPLQKDEVDSFLNSLKNELKVPSKLEFNLDFERDERNRFSDKIYQLFPKVTMTEMIYEVNSWTKLLDDFKEGLEEVSEKQKVIVATLLANGHNIGFSKMAISSSIDESTLRRANEYYFVNTTLSKAQKTLVNYHNSLGISKNWGKGDKSSSDGMRIPITSKTIYADYNSHYGNRGGGIYRHITDKYTPYYVQMLEGRDSNHVLDGLLYHGTDLDIYEHSTDTAGYTEQMFALTYLLGFKFKPRIKSSEKQQLYSFEALEVNGKRFKKINEQIIIENFQEIMRLVESIRCEKVKASVILRRISSYARDNSVAKALKEIGRIVKTIYLLDYFSDEQVRKEVQQILNKGEAMNSVARLVHFGKQGKVNKASIEEQLERASSLNVLLGIIVTWNTRYLEKVYNQVKDEEWFCDKEFKRVSPLGTTHVNFLGRYVFEEKRIETKDGLRPLNSQG